jgi:xanthine dehydrogenase accessory factor
VEEAARVLDGAAPRTVSYGISDEQAIGVGLMCGGTVQLFVAEITEAHRDAFTAVRDAVVEDRPVALATVLDGACAGAKLAVLEDDVIGSLDGPELLTRSVIRDARGFLDEGLSAVRRDSARGEVLGAELRVHLQAFAASPVMIIFGAIDFSAALARQAVEIGFRVTICDARSAFAHNPRFAAHADVVVDWPDRHLAGRTLGPRDAVLVFTHDPKFDEPALIAALSGGAGYVGALGSRRTHASRIERLRAAGVADAELDRIHAPCGLDIGARTPAETAISVLAEILAARSHRPGGRLVDADGPIHARPTHSA